MSGPIATDEVLVAAVSLAGTDHRREFSEWDLTVEAWKLNCSRWGLRGYEQTYPDHKRVMMELMGDGGLVQMGLLERARPNYYRVTPAGFARALAFIAPRDTRQRNIHIYDDLKPYAFHRVFEAYLRNSNEPQTWLGAAAFLNLQRYESSILESRLSRIRQSISVAREFMRDTSRAELRRGDSDRTITRDRLDKLEGFLSVLESRFSAQIAAIRARN